MQGNRKRCVYGRVRVQMPVPSESVLVAGSYVQPKVQLGSQTKGGCVMQTTGAEPSKEVASTFAAQPAARAAYSGSPSASVPQTLAPQSM